MMDEQNEQAQDDANAQKKVVITCESNVDISVAKDFYQLLSQALQERQHVEIDASQVERVDGSILQLLHSFSKEAQSAGLEMNIKAVSDAFTTSMRLLGMEKSLQTP